MEGDIDRWADGSAGVGPEAPNRTLTDRQGDHLAVGGKRDVLKTDPVRPDLLQRRHGLRPRGQVCPDHAVEPGRAYVFRAFAASNDGASAWLDIGLYDDSGAWLGGRSSGCARERPRAGRWEPIELRYVNDDPRVAWVRLSLLHCLNHSAGEVTTLHFDDASFAAAAGP